MLECPHCGARIEPSAGRCPNCGNMLAPDYEKPSYSAPDYGASAGGDAQQDACAPDQKTTGVEGNANVVGSQAPAAAAGATPAQALTSEEGKPSEPDAEPASQSPLPGVEYYSGGPIRPKQANTGAAGTFGSTAKTAESTTNSNTGTYTTSRDSAPSAGPCPSSHIFLSILSLVCCCIPTGIIALINSFRVSSLWQAGRYSEAESASKSAKLWSLLGMGLVIAFWVAMAIYGSTLDDAASITDSITNLFDA